MGGRSSPSSTTTVQKSDPWSGQQPYLTEGFKAAQQEFRSGRPEYFPDSTVVPYSPETETALNMRTQQATDPNSLLGMAGTETAATLRGDYLQAGNPVYDQMLQGVTRSVRPGVDSAFAGSGRFGSPLHSEALGRGISQGMVPYIAAERGRQYGAAQDADRVSRFAPGALAEVGQAREGMSRQELQEDIDRWNFEQNREKQKIADYMGAITGNYGGTTNATTTQPRYSNPLMSGLGTAGSAANLVMTPFGGGKGMFGMK